MCGGCTRIRIRAPSIILLCGCGATSKRIPRSRNICKRCGEWGIDLWRSRSRIQRAPMAAALIFVFGLLPATAAALSWSGVLRDAAGSPVSEATITLRSSSETPVSGTRTYTATISASGVFTFSSITSGKYELSVGTKAGSFKSAELLDIQEGTKLTAGLQLSSPEKGQVLLQAEAASAPQGTGGEHLSAGEVSSLPLNSRDFSKLLLLAAGTMTDTNGAANFTQQFAVNGQRGSATVFALDGADTTDPEMGGATFSNFNVDAIQEVQSSAGVLPAETGHGAASFTNVMTKSGVNL